MVNPNLSRKILPLLAALLLLSACVPAPAPSVTPIPPVITAPTQTQPAVPTAALPQASEAPTINGTTGVPETGGQQVTSAPPEATAGDTSVTSAPQCTSPAELTPAQTEGPYFKAGSPERASLVDNLPGTRLVMTGFVLDQNCQPVSGALLDFWQADSLGQYDNAGYTLRGHQFTDETGQYRLETVVPGEYPGRTEHIHVKIQAPNGPVLTTQLYFPDVSQNQRDGIFNSALLVQVESATQEEMKASFNFVIAR